MPRQLPRRRPPDFEGDFPDGDSITEAIERIPPAWDARGIPFRGTSAPAAVPATRSRRMTPPAGIAAHEVIGRSTAQGWRHLFELRCQYPAADHGTPIPCGRTYTDHDTRSFRELWQSGQAAGWHLDALGRMCCPRCCQDSGAYQTLYPVTLWDPAAAAAEQAGDPETGFRYRAALEYALICDVQAEARRGRHHRSGGAR